MNQLQPTRSQNWAAIAPAMAAGTATGPNPIAVYYKAWNPPYLQIQTELLAVNRISMPNPSKNGASSLAHYAIVRNQPSRSPPIDFSTDIWVC